MFVKEVIQRHHSQDTSYIQFIDHYENIDFCSVFCEFNDDGSLAINDITNTRFHNKPSLAIENISLVTLANLICHHLHLPLDKICSESQARRISLARSMIVYFAHYHAKYTLEDIATLLGRQAKSISHTLHRHLRLAIINHDIRNTMTSLERKLSLPDVPSLK